MKTKRSLKNYTIGILIALGLYFISSSVSSLINVLVSFSAGYSKYSDFLAGDNIAGLLVIFIVGLSNHLFTAWLTVKLMLRYGEKNDSINKCFFGSAAIAVIVYALIAVPIIFSRTPGWMTYSSHSLGIWLFGLRSVRIYDTRKATTFHANTVVSTPEAYSYFVSEDTLQNTNTKIDSSNLLCPKCGEKLRAEVNYCHKCGAMVKLMGGE